mmetsp:Transcript_21941/g.30737  ORF Transcript_21941/g.30737 Transcript_21941/m.30737 type:complete len:225 (+) Transcript_21941:456-1130(+)
MIHSGLLQRVQHLLQMPTMTHSGSKLMAQMLQLMSRSPSPRETQTTIPLEMIPLTSIWDHRLLHQRSNQSQWKPKARAPLLEQRGKQRRTLLVAMAKTLDLMITYSVRLLLMLLLLPLPPKRLQRGGRHPVVRQRKAKARLQTKRGLQRRQMRATLSAMASLTTGQRRRTTRSKREEALPILQQQTAAARRQRILERNLMQDSTIQILPFLRKWDACQWSNVHI